VEMCHCKTCADRLHVIIVTIAMEFLIHLLPVSSGFHFYTMHSVHFSAFFMHYP